MIKKMWALFLIAFGVFMLLGFLNSSREYSFAVTTVSLALFVAAPVLSGVSILRRRRKAKERAAEESKRLLRTAREKEILKIAEDARGTITVAQILLVSDMSASEAEDVLHDFVVKRIADVHTDSSGQAVFEFFQFLERFDPEMRRLEPGVLRE